MSTSNSNVPLGECVVCGQETATRCSKCAQGGVEWMFFCSKEHQRAIWNVHKRVCGRPFQWPVINLKEKEEMLELMPKSWRSYDGKTQTWLDQVHDTIEGQEDFLEKLMIVRDDRHPSSSMMLCNYRYTAFKIKYAFEDPTYKGLDHDIFDELIAADPLGFLAYAHCCYYPTVEQKPEAEWYSDFQHRMLCFIGVFLYSRPSVVAILEDSAVRQRREHFKYTISQVQESARNGIQKFDPNLTRTILTQFPSMLKRIGA